MKRTFNIQNLKCGGCASSIISKLNDIKAIDEVEVDVESTAVTVQFSSEEALPLIKNTLHAIGYPIVGDSNSIVTKAKSFVSCATGKFAK